MAADMEMKRRTLEKIHEPGSNPFQFRPDDTMLVFGIRCRQFLCAYF
jgi:hypothetical protein